MFVTCFSDMFVCVYFGYDFVIIIMMIRIIIACDAVLLLIHRRYFCSCIFQSRILRRSTIIGMSVWLL